MKQYTITMKFRVEAEKANLNKITEYADELSENIMGDTKLVYNDDIEIIDVVVDDIENNIDDYDEEEDYSFDEED
jgi:hypothetical protein